MLCNVADRRRTQRPAGQKSENGSDAEAGGIDAFARYVFKSITRPCAGESLVAGSGFGASSIKAPYHHAAPAEESASEPTTLTHR